jgi:putative endonuclease
MKHNNKVTGEIGEQLACDFLLNKGYQILERNYQQQKTEVDIIAKHQNCLVIVEVKTRSSNFVNPESAVSKAKQKNLVEAAVLYQEKHAIKSEIRFDIIAIIKTKLETEILHFEDAFYPYTTY